MAFHDEIECRRWLRQSAYAELCRLKREPVPECKFRMQAKRLRMMKIRAARLAEVPFRPAAWLGRRLRRPERSRVLQAVRWFEDANVWRAVRGPRGHVRALQFLNVRREVVE
jgi:hypothetical protein